MTAILIEKDGTRHVMEIEGCDTAGVVLRNDTRMDPPLRVFRYVPNRKVLTLPAFEEVSFVHINAVPSER